MTDKVVYETFNTIHKTQLAKYLLTQFMIINYNYDEFTGKLK